MSRPGRIGPTVVAALAMIGPGGPADGQDFLRPAPDPTAGAAVVAMPADGMMRPDGPGLPTEVQLVRFHGPPGLRIEVVEPSPAVVAAPAEAEDPDGLTVGLMVGVGYRLRLSNLPNRPDAELFPVIEVVGHLHRPASVDPFRFPIRVVFGLDDLVDVADSGRLVTQIVYLEDPDQALPISMPDEEIPMVTLDPSEEPLRVADALGRVMAIVRIGGRAPLPGEPIGFGDLGLSAGPCPFQPSTAPGRCGVPVCPPLQPSRPPTPIFPGDEYLCDGGDHGSAGGIGPDGRIIGIEPRDAMVRFNPGAASRVLPTNTVCIYAPRFAAVRTSVGPNESRFVATPLHAERLQRMEQSSQRVPPLKVSKYETAEAVRVRERASGMRGRTGPIAHLEVRVLNGFSTLQRVNDEQTVQGAEVEKRRAKAELFEEQQAALGIKTAEGPVITGIVQGAGQTVMTWPAEELAGVEVPPDRPGLAVVKEADTAIAEPGTLVTYTIRWRNMGNVPIDDVSIVDSLLPRLEYVVGSARGPDGAVFTAAENAVGSTELRWDLPAPLPPGSTGAVSFQARVR